MSAPIILSAYRQLQPAEKSFVDMVCTHLETQSARNFERITNTLYRPLPSDIVRGNERFLERALVSAAITERVTEIAAATELTHHRIINEISRIAFSNIDDFIARDMGRYAEINLDDVTRDQMAAVAQYDYSMTDKGGVNVKLKMHNKLDALKMLATFTGLLQPDNAAWRADTARPVREALPVSSSESDASRAYSDMIEG